MANDLTGLKIKDTYARVVQVVSGSYYDGLGNPLIITGSQGPSGSKDLVVVKEILARQEV